MASIIPIRGDLVSIEKVGGFADLEIKNSSQNVDGFAWNEGGGKLRFKRAILDIATEADLDLYGRNDGDYVAVKSNNSIYAWRPSGIPDEITVFDADDDGVWELILGVGGAGAAPYFQATIGSVFSLLVTSGVHGITNVRGAAVLTPGRAEMDVYMELRANDDVYIESNINLNNYILKIY